jgi:hypothetical protein
VSRISESVFLLLISALFFLVPSSQAQDKKESAPLPVQIATAKRVFLSNAGTDSMSLAASRGTGDPDLHYSRFHAALKSWGRYELVSTPADADLVFELRFTAPLSGCNSMDSYSPQITVTILDAKSHFILWSLTEPIKGAFRKQTWLSNMDKGIAALVEDLKRVADPATNGQSGK